MSSWQDSDDVRSNALCPFLGESNACLLVLQTHPRRPIRQQQLTSRSFTTLDPDQSDDRRPNLILSQSHSADIMHVPDRLEIPTFSPTKPGTRLAPIGRAPARIDQSDKGTQTDDEKWMLQQKTYTSSLYIDSLAPSVNVPLEIQKDGKDTEVMIFLEGLNIESCHRPDSKFVPSAISSPQNGGKDEKRFVSTVELVSARAANGHLALTPVTSRSMEVTQGQPTVERSPKVVGRLSGQREAMSGVSDHHHLDSVVLDPMSYSVSYSAMFFCKSMVSFSVIHFCCRSVVVSMSLYSKYNNNSTIKNPKPGFTLGKIYL